MTENKPSLIVPTHDAILPKMIDGVKWALPNVGDNQETSNLAMARIFEKVGEYLQAFSVLTDCFVPAPPTIRAVRAHHNMFVRLNNLIDASTKPDSLERLEADHITHPRRKLKLYPVRYFDVKNDYCRRWIELCLQGLSNMAQLTENTWSNDWSPATASEMKKLFREAYRLMACELFQVTPAESAKVFDDETPWYLTKTEIDGYSTAHIPAIEWIKHPALGSVFTEDELRDIATPNVVDAPGVAENDKETPQRERERRAQGEIA